MHQIKVSNIVIDVIRKNIKNLRLAVYPPEGRVRVAVPLRINDEAVRLFAISKLSWIKDQQAKFETQEPQSKIEYLSGETHYFEGHSYILNVIYHNGPPKVELRDNKYIDLYVRTSSSIQQRERVIKEWYRQKLKEKIPALLDKWQRVIGVKVNDWQIRQMKTRWGSCKIEAKRIWLNLELAQKSLQCLEYIIVHELVHLLERNHNKRFRNLMTKFMPEWKLYQNELDNRLGHNPYNK